MSLLDALRKKLTPEQLTEITDALGDDFNYDVVPRTRLNKALQRARTAEANLAKLQEGTQTSDSDEDDDDDFGDGHGTQRKPLKASGKSKQSQPVDEAALRKQFEDERDAAIAQVRIQYAGLDALRKAGAVDPEVAFSLLDASKLSFDDKGTLVGIDEQITAQRAAKAYLYGSSGGRNGTDGGTGRNGGGTDFGGVNSKADFDKLSSTDQLKFMEEHPEQFRAFTSSIF